jgi:hypothetical protein
VSVGNLLLEQNISYEQLMESKKGTVSIPLIKDEFEKVADLLRKIQIN